MNTSSGFTETSWQEQQLETNHSTSLPSPLEGFFKYLLLLEGPEYTG